jgi:arylsulfatase A-like enzyme
MKKPLAIQAFVLALLAGPALVVSAEAPAAAGKPQAAARPSFLFIYTDDQRWDSLAVTQREQGDRARFPWLRSPNLDRLAAEGARFRNAFVVNSLCAPSRACYLTGRYSHLNGIANNRTPFPADAATHASLLRAAGYATGYVGKWHMGSQRGPRPGFDYSASFIGQGRYEDCPFEIDGVKTDTKGWVDDVSTDFAIEFIKKNRAGPFLCVVGYKSSHGPWDPPERAKGLYAGEFSRPAASAGHRPPYLKPIPPERKEVKQFDIKPDSERSEMHRKYFRTLAAVDDNVGRLLKALDDLHLAESTVVVYTSDNGFYLGEHGLGDKRSAYEESIRIPLLVRAPSLAARGKVIDEMVLNIDLAPTFLDLAGVPVPAEMQGRSWKPLLAGEPAQWRKAFFYEYFLEAGMGPPTVLAVRAEAAKLIKYPGHGDWTELFDLKADPYEMKNLFSDPASADLRKRMEEEYDRQASAVQFRIPEYADKAGDAPRARARQARDRNVFVLRYDLGTIEGGKVPDVSGKGHHGKVVGVTVAEGRPGRSVVRRKAGRFDGRSCIEVANSAALDPSGGPWTFEACFKAESPDGVVLARGGMSRGYALFIEGGKPGAAVTVEGSTTTVLAERAVAGDWVRVAVVIGSDRKLRLYINGEHAGEKPLASFIQRDPNEALQIGADRGSPVAQYAKPGDFVGLIESVALFCGERPAEELKAAAKE